MMRSSSFCGLWKNVLLAAAVALMLSACSGSGTEAESSLAETKAESSLAASEVRETAKEAGNSSDSEYKASDTRTEDDEVQDPGIRVLYPYLETQYDQEYDAQGQLLASVSYQTIKLYDETGSLGALNAALDEWNAARAEEADVEFKALLEIASAASLLSSAEFFNGYQSQSSIEIMRADSSLLSFIETVYSFTGGAHGNAGLSCANYDSETGRKLELTDVVSDTEALADYIIEHMGDGAFDVQGLFEDWQDIVRAEITDGTENAFTEESAAADESAKLKFVLTEDSLRAYFVPYEIGPWALGTVTVDVPYTVKEIGFNEAYISGTEQTVWRLDPYTELRLDINSDGVDEVIELSYQTTEDQNQFAYKLFVGEGQSEEIEGSSVSGSCGYGIQQAYIMKTPEDGYVFYGECLSDNDWRYLTIIDISDMSEAEPVEYYEAFYDNVPVSSGSFYLSTRGDLISTCMLRREHKAGANGLPLAVQEDFYVNDLLLTSKIEVRGTDTKTGSELVIPVDTDLRVVSSDEFEHVVVELEDGRQAELTIDADEWPHRINGTDIEECFEGVYFAG